MCTLAKARYSSMKHICKCALRFYADLEYGKSLCCTLTFILYFVFFCKNVDALIQNPRKIIIDSYEDDRSIS